jgi:Xaa-Pro aminopeptidase
MKDKDQALYFMYASSEQSADLFYLAGVYVPDPYLTMLYQGESYAFVNQLEYGRVASKSKYDHVFLLEQVKQDLAVLYKCELAAVGPALIMRHYARQFQQTELAVPHEFPAIYFSKLQAYGLKVHCRPCAQLAQRALKSDVEVAAIRQANRASAAGLRTAQQILESSQIVGKRLRYQGRFLTADYLRQQIDIACLNAGALARHTIVACGRQACDPHEAGSGYLQPHQLIIVDVFPRHQKTGYHGDMTRTFLKGQASDAQRRLVGTVRQSQRAAMATVQAGRSGHAVHQAATAVFDAVGFKTERRGQKFVGFIHSTGHGLGLEVHEPPRVAPNAGALHAGHVVTIEPGLYYPEIGGCRIEDVVAVANDGAQLLSKMNYKWCLA